MLHHRIFVWSRCFAIAHVCYPTLILNIIVRCDVLSSGLLMFCHFCHVIFLSLSRWFAIALVCSRCFAIAHVCYPTLIFNIIFRCNVSSSCLIFCYHACILSFYMSLCYHAMCYYPLCFSIIVKCNVSSSCLIFCYHVGVFLPYLSLCCHAMSCHLFLLFYHHCWCFYCSIWCFAILSVVFISLTKKHKPTKIYEPNYGCSDSLKGIRKH